MARTILRVDGCDVTDTGKRFNVYDVLVMALDEVVLEEQIRRAKERIETLGGMTAQKRQNFDMSVRMVKRSLQDRERVEKIQGLLNELLAFLEDDLSIITGAYEDLLTLDEVLDQDLILLVSLNTNANERAVEALGKIILQNVRLMVGKRYSREPDFDEWGHRLEIFGLDMRSPSSVETFCRHLFDTHPRLDFIINNACQTVRRPPEFYAHMMQGERSAVERIVAASRSSGMVFARSTARSFSGCALCTKASDSVPSMKVTRIRLAPLMTW